MTAGISLQVTCFNTPLQPDELLSVLETVSDKLPAGVSNNGLTLAGFLFLHALFMERGRFETTWQVLRKFGYTNDLTLSEDLLADVQFDHAPDQVGIDGCSNEERVKENRLCCWGSPRPSVLG